MTHNTNLLVEGLAEQQIGLGLYSLIRIFFIHHSFCKWLPYWRLDEAWWFARLILRIIYRGKQSDIGKDGFGCLLEFLTFSYFGDSRFFYMCFALGHLDCYLWYLLYLNVLLFFILDSTLFKVYWLVNRFLGINYFLFYGRLRIRLFLIPPTSLV
jgi:hypothetical protein